MPGTDFSSFCERFPDESSCLQKVFDAKFGDHGCCPHCGEVGGWGKVVGTKKFFHKCRKQISPLKDTVLYRSNISISAFFYTILLFSNFSSGVRSSFVRKQLGLTPRSSHVLCNRVRLHMAAYDRPDKVGGVGKEVEVDEVQLRHVRLPGVDRHMSVCVVGIAFEGKVIAGITRDRTRNTLHDIILRHVKPGSTIITDDWTGYKGLRDYGYKHKTVNHSIGYFNEYGVSTCNIDSYWATLRRVIRLYRQVATHNLWLFLAETEARYNFRHDYSQLFEHLTGRWPKITPETSKELMRRYDWR